MRTALLTVAMLLGLGSSSLGTVANAAEEPANPDVAIVSNTANVRHAKVGQVVIFTIVVTFSGPEVVPNIFVNTDPEPPNLAPASILCNPRRGECGYYMICDRPPPLLGPSPDTPSCEFGEPHLGELLTVKAAFVVQAGGGKYASFRACATLPDFPPGSDPNPDNDCATASVKIVGKRR
jgi:uncharacterized repeat protein (TIGR01451 family)